MKQYLDEYVTYLEDVKGLSRSTIESYRADLQGFIAFAEERDVINPQEVTRTMLGLYMGRLRQRGQGGIKPASRTACVPFSIFGASSRYRTRSDPVAG